MALTHQEFDRRVEEAMKPPANANGQNFTPGIEDLRQAAKVRKPSVPGKQLTIAR